MELKYTEKMKQLVAECENPRRDLGITYDTMWNIIYDRDIRIQSLMHILDHTGLKLEDLICTK